jgi:hypothetical protein
MFRKHCLHKFILSALCSLAIWQLNAQVKFSTYVTDAEIVVGQTFQVQYILEGAAEKPQFIIPSFKQFIVHESFDNKSTSIQSPGLQMVEVHSKIVWLSVNKPGYYIIPGAIAFVNGKRLFSQPKKIRVHTRSSVSAVKPGEYEEDIPIGALSELKPGDDLEDRIRRNLFLKTITSKNSCYVGETLMLTYKLYSRLNANSQILKRPSLTGLSIVEMVDSYDTRPEIEKLNGIPYYVNLVRKVQGFPLQPGTMQLDLAEVGSTVKFVRIENDAPASKSLDDLINQNKQANSGRTYFDHEVTLVSNPLSIEVKPLPVENQPANFTGAVGRFEMSIVVPEEEIHPGDLVKIQVIVKGTGNIPLLVAPDIKWPRGVDTAEPSVKEEFNKYVFPLQGHKSFEYSFEAPDTGSYIIPATEFVFFNPAMAAYEKSISRPAVIKVVPGKPKREKIDEAEELASAKQNTALHFYWFGVVVLLIISWIVFQFWRGKKSSRKEMMNTQQLPQAESVEKIDPLAKTRQALERQDLIPFYHELEQALWKLVADYCEVLPSAMNRKNVSMLLAAKNIDAETIRLFEELLSECEWALYVPSHQLQNAAIAFEKAERIATRLC